MINRAAVLLKYKKPAIDWINEADPTPSIDRITEETVNHDRLVYLIRSEDADSDDDVLAWVKENFEVLWETELEGWYTDESLWPTNRTWKEFQKWFQIEWHTMLEDTVDEPVFDEDI